MTKNNPVKDKKILIIHYRVGKTDGVSLQISSWKEILEDKGAQVLLCSGPENSGADYVINDLEPQLNPEIFTIDEDAFNGLNTYKDDVELIEHFKLIQLKLQKEFIKIIDQAKPDLIIVSNIFSVGENLPATGALTKAIELLKIPTLAIHHDFYWESYRYRTPTNKFIAQQLVSYFPPKRPWLTHACINSIAQQELFIRKKINAILFPDTFNFDQHPWKKQKQVQKIFEKHQINKNDLIIMQATRIVRRKNIELAIDLVSNLNQKRNLEKLESRSLYDGRKFNSKTDQIALVLSGYAEFRDKAYLNQLLRYASKRKVKMHLLRELVNNSKSISSDKIHALWDSYPFADFITYPSEYEGFGNQFLEAVFAKKPVVMFEYPVWTADIRSKGFEIISLGNELSIKSNDLVTIPRKTMNQAVLQLIKVLTDKNKYHELVDKNFEIGKDNFSYENAWSIMERVFEELSAKKI